jgi:hypothetical protein
VGEGGGGRGEGGTDGGGGKEDTNQEVGVHFLDLPKPAPVLGGEGPWKFPTAGRILGDGGPWKSPSRPDWGPGTITRSDWEPTI